MMVDCCPHCGSTQVLKKTSGMGGRRRENEAPYFCDNCKKHVEEPVDGQPRLPTNDHTGASPTVRALLDADPDTAIPKDGDAA